MAWAEFVERDKRDSVARLARKLGSTEIACVAALYNPALAAELPKNKTATDVWLRLVHGLDVPRNSRMDRGNRVEPIAIDYYREHVGPAWRALPVGEWWTVVDKNQPMFTASHLCPNEVMERGVGSSALGYAWHRRDGHAVPVSVPMAVRAL